MPRDYKHRAQKKPARKPLPGWLWLLTGLLVGGFIAALFWLQGQSEEAGGEWVGAKPDRPPQGVEERPSAPPSTPPPKPRFDFYEVLPRMEVEVQPAPVPRPSAKAATGEPAAPPASASVARSYQLQVGSFRRPEDADRRKAELAMSGFEVDVTQASVGQNDIRYRVRSRLYSDRQSAERARAQLAANGFDSLIIRAPGR